jgi:long-chain acyl-CoA synthetase
VHPLAELAQADPDRLVLSDSVRTLTRAQLDDRVNRLVAMLRAEGVREGDAVAIMSTNCTDHAVALLACGLGGMSQVPVNWHFSADEAEYLMTRTSAVALIVGPAQEEVGRAAAAAAGITRVHVIGPSLDAELEAAPGDAPDPQPLVANPIYFTSGTTGRPKSTRMAEVGQGVPIEAFVAQARSADFDETSRVLIPGPLYHGGPLMQTLRSLVVGGQLWIMQRFDAEEFLRLVQEHRIVRSLTVPTHLVRLNQLPEHVKHRYDTSSLVELSHIGAMMPGDIKRELIGWLGPVLVDAYGCTELGMVSRISSTEWLAKPGSIGQPMNGFRAHIVDPDTDRELPTNEVGMIYLSNDHGADIVYLDDPERTAACHRAGGSQYTIGDMGYLDDDGYLFLVDRRVDLIISGGVNIYPAEIEALLLNHPDIVDVGVFAVPDPEWGHAVKAAVQLQAGLTGSPEREAEIIAWSRERIAHFKVPRSIDFHVDLPRFSNGKLHRRALRAPYWDSTAGPSSSSSTGPAESKVNA